MRDVQKEEEVGGWVGWCFGIGEWVAGHSISSGWSSLSGWVFGQLGWWVGGLGLWDANPSI